MLSLACIRKKGLTTSKNKKQNKKKTEILPALFEKNGLDH